MSEPPGYTAARKGSVTAAIVWMFIISVLLFWVPVIGGFVAGFVGGRKAGSIGRALAAVFLPGIVFGVLLGMLAGTLVGLPLIGALVAFGGSILAVAHVGPMLIGAIIGGATA
jgi:hypothetical protein